MRITLTSVALGALVLACIGATKSRQPDSSDLGGSWQLLLSGSQSDDTSHTSGEVALLPGSWIDRANLVSVKSYEIYGIYDVDFSPFDFDCRPKSGVPLVGARSLGSDSVELVLNPQTDHGGVVLQGHRSRDGIAGFWYERREGGRTGSFIMRRE